MARSYSSRISKSDDIISTRSAQVNMICMFTLVISLIVMVLLILSMSEQAGTPNNIETQSVTITTLATDLPVKTDHQSRLVAERLTINDTEDLSLSLHEKESLIFLNQTIPPSKLDNQAIDQITLFNLNGVLSITNMGNVETMVTSDNTTGDTIIPGTLTIPGLTPNLPLKSGATGDVVASNLLIADTTGLGTALQTKTTLDFIDSGSTPLPIAGQIVLYNQNDELWIVNSEGQKINVTSGDVLTQQWDFSSSTSTVPDSGTVRFNHINAPSATSIYISSITTHGNDLGPLLDRLGNGDSIYICTEDVSNCKLFNITATAVNNITWFNLTVTFVSETMVPPFTDTELMGISIFTIGNPFDQQLNTTDDVTFNKIETSTQMDITETASGGDNPTAGNLALFANSADNSLWTRDSGGTELKLGVIYDQSLNTTDDVLFNKIETSTQMDITETASGGDNPTAGNLALFANSADNSLWTRTSGGVEVKLGVIYDQSLNTTDDVLFNKIETSTQMDITETASGGPDPSAGNLAIFANSADNSLWTRDSGGTELKLGVIYDQSLNTTDDVLFNKIETSTQLDITETASGGPNPSAGNLALFANSADNSLWTRTSGGVEVKLGGSSFDQSLNTTDSVQFVDIDATGDVVVTGAVGTDTIRSSDTYAPLTVENAGINIQTSTGQYPVNFGIFTLITDKTVTGAVAESIFGDVNGSIVFDGFIPGSTVASKIGGTYTCGNNNGIQWFLTAGIDGLTVIYSSDVINCTGATTEKFWEFEVEFTTRVTGGPGVALMAVNGSFAFINNGGNLGGGGLTGTTNANLDLTITNIFGVSVLLVDNASQSITSTVGTAHKIY